MGYVKVLVCWGTGNILTNRLPKLSLITPPPGTAGYAGSDRIYGSMCQSQAVPFLGGLTESNFQVRHGKFNFFS